MGGGNAERLDKIVAASGAGTRRQAREWIRHGRVTVDGRVVTDPGEKVAVGQATVTLDGEPLATGPMTVMLNKPRGVITATADARHATVVDLLPEGWRRRLVPAGRLDRDTEGLLILTDDGDLCHRIISPRHGVEKEYVAEVDGPLPPGLAASFARGVVLDDGYRTLPARLVPVRTEAPGVARVTVTEGKYHQIKRMFAAHGLRVRALRRVRIGSLTLDPDLPPGGYRLLDEQERAALLRNPEARGSAGGADDP